MIQHISPHRFDNQYIPDKLPGSNDFVLHYKEKSILLIAGDEGYSLPRKKDLTNISATIEAVFLFTLDDIPCFLMRGGLNTHEPSHRYMDVYSFRTSGQKELAWVSLAGFHLYTWYEQNKFCGSCGSATQYKSDERALLCPACHTTFFPKISPAVIVAILCKDRILLARNSNFPGAWYSLLAGYSDIGESLEETVRREVKEEVGLDIRNVRYYTSQPWPFSGSLMVGFIAEADDTQPILIDGKEIVQAAWFERNNLPQHPPNLSISGEMIEKFGKGEL